MKVQAPYRPLDDAQIRARWLADFGEHPNPDAAFDKLVATYRGPQRFYHTIEHGMEVANSARSLSAALPPDDADDVCLAAWCHDAHYDRLATDNEERSASFAVDIASLLGIASDRGARLYDIVLMSRHTVEPKDRLAKIMCDADLAVLGKPWPGYCYDVANIRAELQLDEDNEWRTARLKMLSFFAHKQPLYHLEQAANAWAEKAVANREHETALLSAG